MRIRHRRQRKLSYELIACGLEGHALVGTDAATIGPEHTLMARESDGVRWHRCLRCDAWVVVPPPQETGRRRPPERDEIDLPLRGRPLRDRFVLRLIALDRAVHVVVLGVLAAAVFAFTSHHSQLQSDYYRILADLQGGLGPGSPVHHGLLGELDKVISLRTKTLELAGLVLAGYGVLEAVEMVGLWLARRWAEYLTFVATTLLLPLEVYELTSKVSALKVVALVINLAVVVYLLTAKRLFGLRGGGRAERAEREADMGWAAIERATPQWRPEVPASTVP
ncbi:MAG: DUF2127 domain-containing protein [Acidimicrobiales bacterium]|nr:MAG: DUF2127 domain-containing protein [Acidimicrobiales bacterium]